VKAQRRGCLLEKGAPLQRGELEEGSLSKKGYMARRKEDALKRRATVNDIRSTKERKIPSGIEAN